MSATNPLAYLESRGLNVQLEGEKLRVTPSAKITDEDREHIRAHKSEIVLLLKPGLDPVVENQGGPESEVEDTQADEHGRTELLEMFHATFDEVFEKAVHDLVIQMIYEFEERVAIIAEDPSIPEVEAQKLAALDCLSRWLGHRVETKGLLGDVSEDTFP